MDLPTDPSDAPPLAAAPAVPPAAEAAAAPAPPRPDRADAPVSEVTERFLRAIVQRLPLARIEELHLFSPLRQGSVETGIAVVAALPAAASPGPEASSPPKAAVPAGAAVEDVAAAAAIEGDVVDAVDALDAAPEAAAPVEGEVVPEAVATPAPVPPVRRHEVYTARYRLVLKGPERGKWEEDLVVEADAPLLTVETVVRGVQRRAGEATETIRYGAAQVARALRLPDPAP